AAVGHPLCARHGALCARTAGTRSKAVHRRGIDCLSCSPGRRHRRRAGAAVRRDHHLREGQRQRREEIAMSNFWDFEQLLIWCFFLIFYLLVLFQIIGDLFRDSQMGGVAKALWIVCLFVLPLLTAIIYIVVRGRGMSERQRASLQRAKEETDAYIRH